MAKSGVTIKVDMKVLARMERNAPGITKKVVRKIAFDVQTYAQTHMSTHFPSAPGEPPGVPTGNLKGNIHARQLNETTWRVSADTEYAAMLEFGTVNMEARPFMEPAAEAIAPMLPRELTAVVKP
jgi:HK97 gp10 family phage protein